ncbi:MAG: V-type ATP synthase subunit E [Candidatus Bathyarchaeia archaeon]
MSAEKIREYIEKETEAEVKRIIENAEAEARRIIEEAKERASARLEELRHKRLVERLARERSELSIMRMTQRAELIKIKTEWLNRVFDEAYKRIGEMAKDPGSTSYRNFLMGLVVEGATALRGSKLLLKADTESGKFLQRSLKELSDKISEMKGERVELEVESQPNSPLGVIIQSSDGRRYYSNTLEARLARVRERIGGSIYNMLFKEGD